MAIDPWGTSGGYLSEADFRAAMDVTFGKGKWRETGGWRSQAREAQLRAQGAQTVKPGAISAHSVGTADAPGAHDIVVDGLTPAQAAAKLKAAGLPTDQVLPEGGSGTQGPHLHVGLAAGGDPWGTAGDPWGSAPAPVQTQQHSLLDEGARLWGALAGGAVSGAGKVVKGFGELADIAGHAQLGMEGATGVMVDPATGQTVQIPERFRPALTEASKQPLVAPAAKRIGGKIDQWGDDLAPKDRNLPESIVHGAGEMAVPLVAAAINPAAGGAAFAAQGTEATEAEAQAAGADLPSQETAGLESGAIQGGLGMVPAGHLVEGLARPIVKGVEGRVLPFLGRLSASVTGNAALGGSMQAGENVVAAENYDPTRPWYQNVPESAASMAVGGAVIHTGGEALGALRSRLRPAESPAQAEPASPEDVAAMPEAAAAHAYAQNSAHLAGAHTPDEVPVHPVEPPAAYEEARIAEGAPVEQMAPAIADVEEMRNAAPKGYSLFQAIKDLGGVRTKTPEGEPIGDTAQLLQGVRRPGLVNNKTGLDPDTLREALQERGWFGVQEGEGERRGDTLNDLYGLLDQEARGNKVYHPEDVAPQAILHRVEMEKELSQAGVTLADPTAVAAAKLAAYRGTLSKEHGIDMTLLRERAKALGIEHGADRAYDDLLGDVIEREAIQGEYDGAQADEHERLIDEQLTPEEHEWLAATGRSGEGEPGSPDISAETGWEPAFEPGEESGDREPGAGAEGDPWGSQAAPEPHQLGAAQNAGVFGGHPSYGTADHWNEFARTYTNIGTPKRYEQLYGIKPPPGAKTEHQLPTGEKTGREKFDALRAQVAVWRHEAAQLALRGAPVRMEHADGRSRLIGPDLNHPGAFRSTAFDKSGEPWGHEEYPSLEAAIFDELQSGFLPKDAPATPAIETHILAGERVQQSLLAGTERSAHQAAAAREGALKAKTDQEAPGGLFAERPADQPGMFDERPVAKPEGRVEARKPEPEPITDAGEKIGGARKDQWAERGLRLADLEGMSAGEAHQYVVKDQVWPKPDWAAQVEDDVEPEAAALKKVIRDRLAAKPRVDSAVGRRNYVEMMGLVRDALDGAKTVTEVRAARNQIIHDNLGWPANHYDRPEKAVSDKLFSIFKSSREQLGVSGTDLRKARQMVEEGFPGKAEPWSRAYDVRLASDGQYAIYPKGRWNPEAKGFASREEAATEARALYERLPAAEKEKGALPERPHLDKIERTGADVRQGKNVNGADFVKDFGFRGVEFGNWVASDERQKAANLAYDALHDMAGVLRIPPEAVSLDGKLGLAFGARGKGRAPAHYEPGKLVINLTKLSGAGSLGHEWGHALDHYFGSLDHELGTQGAARGASGWYDRVRDVTKHLANLRPEMAQAFHGVMDAIFHRDLPRAEAVRAQELNVERIQSQIDTQKERLAKHLERTKDSAPDKKFIKQSRDYIEQMERVAKASGERLAALRDETAPYTPAKVKSSYLTQSAKLSGQAGESGYWARPTEMFARAFESYLFDKIKAEGRKSDYLVQGVEPERYAADIYKGNPYPTGMERDAINQAFDHLFKTMDVREGENGPALFRRPEEAAEPLDDLPAAVAHRRGADFAADARLLARNLEGVEPDAIAAKAHADLIREVGRVLDKIAPAAVSRPMRALRESGDGSRIEAAAWRDGAKHIVAWSLDTPDAVGAARHEAVHALRGAGLFKPQEWSALAAEAMDGGWMDRYHITDRYPDLTHEKQIEEAIAERFADWRRDRSEILPPFVRELFRRIAEALQQVAAIARKAFGHDATAADVFSAMERGEVGGRALRPEPAYRPSGDLSPAFQRPRQEEAEAVKARGFVNKALGEGVDAIGARLKKTADRVIPDPVHELLDSARMGVSPLSMGSDRAKATAKDFANTLREVAFEWNKIDGWLEKNFTPEQRRQMWEAADEESVIRQGGAEAGPGQGLNRLRGGERAVVEELQKRADDAFARAQALGMTKAEALPSYVPRMVVEMTAEGAQRPRSTGPATSARTGRNLSTTTGQLRHRAHLTLEETEAAAKAGLGEGAMVVRDIRTLGLATGRLEQAIAGRTLVEKIKQIGKSVGEETVSEGATHEPGDFFTIDHPALKTWGPRFAVDHETGKVAPVLGPDGKPVMEAKPLYIAKEFEGPLRAVLQTPTGPIYNAMMQLKGKALSIIMYSPVMHNAVIWGKAIPAAPRQVLTFEIYRRGSAARADTATMREAIHAGLDPIGRRYFNQDITAIAEAPQIAPGRSWTAKLVGGVPALFDKGAGDATKRVIDKLGDVWHNTFLWDRVADLQMGLYKTLRDGEIKKGLDPQSAQRLAAHFANRYAGALPIEGMSKLARQTANLVLFSRSFTLGNVGAYKDIVRGLPGEVQAQIKRDSGVESLNHVQGEARRKAIAMLALDIGLSYAGLWLGAQATAWIGHHAFQSPDENEPGKEKRFLIRTQPDGTAVYGRLPTGKVGEELTDWATEPMETLKRKLSPFARLMYEIAANDKGFGKKLYDPYDKTPMGLARNIGRVTWAAMQSLLPLGQLQGAQALGAATGDKATAALQTFLPVAGITVSKGAPGGPQMGDIYAAKDRQDFAVQEALPGVMQQVRAGDIPGARKKLAELSVAPGLINYYIRVARNPQARLSGRKIQDFRRMATPEERAKFARDRAAAAQAGEAE